MRIVTARAGHSAVAGLKTARCFHELGVLNDLQSFGIRRLHRELNRVISKRLTRAKGEDIPARLENPCSQAVNAALHVALITNCALCFGCVVSWIVDRLFQYLAGFSLQSQANVLGAGSVAAFASNSFRNRIGKVMGIVDLLRLHSWVGGVAEDTTLWDSAAKIEMVLRVVSR